MAGELILGGWSCRGNSANPVFMGLAEFCRADYIGLPDAFVNGVDGQASVRLLSDH